ncbi:MAG: iron-containing alcohol dehydrogenase [Malacoplasma sp.]|nr:iron-containing alcohol dehydrogenase [Malacoplasma sp.]
MELLKIQPKYIFGKNAVNELVNQIDKNKYTKALILTGINSYKVNNSFAELKAVLNQINLDYVHFEGIEPNPKSETIDVCIEFCLKNKIDLIIALGGGSVIDAAKVVATLVKNDQFSNSFQYVLKGDNLLDALDIIAVLTISGTGSESNGESVISNAITMQKVCVSNNKAIPKIAVLDPSYTFSVNPWQTASGIFDSFCHLLEQYFGKSCFEWTKEYIFANLRVLLNYAKMAILRPLHFDVRANIMWTSCMSLNGLASFCSQSDWSIHTIEHAFSGLWDITHGAGLALITPIYLDVRANKEKWFHDKLIDLGRKVFKTKTQQETIEFLINFIKSINLPTRWIEFSKIKEFSNENINFLLNHCYRFGDKNLRQIYEEVILKIRENN